MDRKKQHGRPGTKQDRSVPPRQQDEGNAGRTPQRTSGREGADEKQKRHQDEARHRP